MDGSRTGPACLRGAGADVAAVCLLYAFVLLP